MEARAAMMSLPSTSRYELLVRVASGGMATVYVGRLSGAVGFSRLVAVKRAHSHLLEDEAFTRMLVEEARVASKIRHPNVVSVHDVEELDGELLLVMDYVEGASLSALIARSVELRVPIPLRVVLRILIDASAGLHAAHRATDDDGNPLNLVHRDVSPHNILVGLDGIARIADFGIAKASSSASGTTTGALKGKVAYMAPEYVESSHADARSDVFALGVVAWESITQKRLFRGQNDIETLRLVLAADIKPPSTATKNSTPRIDGIVMNAVARSPTHRFQTAAAFAEALEEAARDGSLLATAEEVGTVVRDLVGDSLNERRAQIRNKTSPGAAKHPESGTTEVDLVPGERNTETLPIASKSEAPPALTHLPAPEMTTLGTGAAARTVEAAREEHAQRGSRAWLAVGVPLFVIAGLGTTAFFVVRRMNVAAHEPEVLTSSAFSIASPSAAAPVASASAAPQDSAAGSATSAPVAIGSARPATISSGVISSSTNPPPAKTGAAAATTDPRKNKPPVNPTSQPPQTSPPSHSPDKAPPNPYAKPASTKP